jgi:hypothetical protein
MLQRCLPANKDFQKSGESSKENRHEPRRWSPRRRRVAQRRTNRRLGMGNRRPPRRRDDEYGDRRDSGVPNMLAQSPLRQGGWPSQDEIFGDDVSQTLARVIDRDPDWSALPRAVPSALQVSSVAGYKNLRGSASWTSATCAWRWKVRSIRRLRSPVLRPTAHLAYGGGPSGQRSSP